MTNRERISNLIKANFPDTEVHWEQNGDTVRRDKNGIEIERYPAFGTHLVITCPDSSEMGSIKWLNSEYKTNYNAHQLLIMDTIQEKLNEVANELELIQADDWAEDIRATAIAIKQEWKDQKINE